MARRKIYPEDLSEKELHQLLLNKRRTSREGRVERFRKTGRAIALAPDLPDEIQVDWRSEPGILPEESTAPAPIPRSRRRRLMDRILLVVEVLAILGSSMVWACCASLTRK
jgi:hypothetical protein